jgi:hypothetical protein
MGPTSAAGPPLLGGSRRRAGPPPGFPLPPPHPLRAGCRNVSLGQTVWLFDIEQDPYETCDLAGSQPDVVSRLRRRLDELNTSAVPCRYPDADPLANPKLHNGTWDSWRADEPRMQPQLL